MNVFKFKEEFNYLCLNWMIVDIKFLWCQVYGIYLKSDVGVLYLNVSIYKILEIVFFVDI